MSAEKGDGHQCPVLRVMVMPRDTNAHGTIFGGVILSYIDQAGAIEARKHAGGCKVVTVAMDRVEFKKPVYVGDVLSLHAALVRRGRSSITVQVDVTAERFEDPSQVIPVTTAQLVFVAIDEAGKAVEIG